MRNPFSLSLSLYLCCLVAGSLTPAVRAAAIQASTEGRWELVVPLPLQPIHSILLRNGQILCLDNTNGTPDTILIDPADPSADLTWIAPATQQPATLFCGAHSQLADGRVFFVGGGGNNPASSHNRAFTFKPGEQGDPWVEMDALPSDPDTASNLEDRRWYATLTTLGTGDVLLTSGRIYEGKCNDVESFQDYAMFFDPDALGTLLFDPQWQRLSNPEALKIVHYYPFMFQLSDQTVFMAGGAYFSPTKDPYIHRDTFLFNPALGAWGFTPVDRADMPGGSAVLYRTDKVMKAGSGDPCGPHPDSSNKVQVIDLQSSPATWSSGFPPMQYARRDFYLIAMPDGRVLATGGRYDLSTVPTDVLIPEWIDPEAADPAWEPLAQMTLARTYHSSGVLLPDARVFMAGTGSDGHDPQGTNCQFFRPPYLFDVGNNDNSTLRPRIDESQTPDTLEYGKGAYIYLDTNYPHDVDASWKVSLIRLGAATHSFDQDQRFMWLAFVPEPQNDRLRVAAPAHGYSAPPGYYMLFVLKEGDRETIYFPSIAKIVQLK